MINRTFLFIGLVSLMAVSMASAQLLPHIVMGTVQNPDGSKPDSAEVEFRGFLNKSPQDTSANAQCSEGGGWAIDVVFGIPNSDWNVGDTLTVLFYYVGDQSAFAGEEFILTYKTTNVSPDSVTTPIVLPVELSTFNAQVVNGSISESVLLAWNTAGETNNYGFNVEKSSDGKVFEKVGFVAGAGSTNTAKHYEFMDENVTIGEYYYRLKQIDYGGRLNYSDVIEVEVQAPTRFELSQNFPNPFNPKTDIVFRLKKDIKVNITVYDILGRRVATIVDRDMTAGSHRITFNGAELPSGTYFCRMTAGDFREVKKMLLLK
ncbi:T9SS type A sorting domain-containing protein [candidate division KSB1 bacterium]|nr:T9SS type A sorting domain-containing protein [candidate division KSB1 bacterium]